MSIRKQVPESDYLTDAFSREAVHYVKEHHEDPFFLYLAFNAVHMPLQASPKYLDRFASIADTKRRTYAAMLSAMDDAIGAVLKELRENNLEQDSLIFFISDNGGPTMTHALSPASPLIDAGKNTNGLTFDQRGAGFLHPVMGDHPIGGIATQNADIDAALRATLRIDCRDLISRIAAMGYQWGVGDGN